MPPGARRRFHKSSGGNLHVDKPNIKVSVFLLGIRVALGADRTEVMKVVFKQAMRPVLIGGLASMAACAAVSKVLSSMLFALSTHDPIAFVAVPLSLLVMAVLACYVAGRRAARVDPLVALRYEGLSTGPSSAR